MSFSHATISKRSAARRGPPPCGPSWSRCRWRPARSGRRVSLTTTSSGGMSLAAGHVALDPDRRTRVVRRLGRGRQTARRQSVLWTVTPGGLDHPRRVEHRRAVPLPGRREVRSTGPDTPTAATTRPASSRTGRADRRHSRLTFLDALAPAADRFARSTRPADPRSSGRVAPTGTIVRNPCGD